MAIRALFAVSALSLSSVLRAGSVLPATADPLLAPSELEHAAMPPQGDDLSRSDLSMERGMAEAGSGAEPTPWSDAALAVANVVDDPWADAYAESARLAALVPRLVAPYQLSMNSQVKFFLDRFTGERRKIVGTWIDRSTRYLAMIRDVLRARGMPAELAVTARIERGYNPPGRPRLGSHGRRQCIAPPARAVR